MRLPSILAAAALLVAVPAAHAANPTPPTIVTGAAESVQQTSATFTATIDPNGAETTYRFQYGTSTSYGLTTATATVPAGDAPVTVKVPVTGLTTKTIYHYRVTATNAAGSVEGADRTVTTQSAPAAPQPPAVSTQPAANTAPGVVSLVARVNARGQATTVFFEYGTTSTTLSSRSGTVAAGSGTSTQTVRVTLPGLAANTRYYYRAVATNAAGVTRGGIRSIATPRQPTAIGLQVTPGTVSWNGSATVNGRVAGSGVGGIVVALERADFPFLTGFREVARANASVDGRFAFPVGPLFSAVQLRAVTRSTPAATSAVLTVGVRAVPGLRVVGGTRRTVVLAGAVSPAIPNGRISVQRLSRSGRWVRIARATPQPLGTDRSTYQVRIRRVSRAARVRVVAIPNDGGAHVNGASRERRVAARRR